MYRTVRTVLWEVGRPTYGRPPTRLDGRTLRRKISSLRQDGHPICSDETGYYYAESQKEINATICRLNTLVTKISNARTGMLYASVLSDEPVSVSIRISLK